MAGKDIMRDELIRMAKQRAQVRNCPVCGKPVLFCSTDEHGNANTNLDWEMKFGTHWKCYVAKMRKMQQGGS